MAIYDDEVARAVALVLAADSAREDREARAEADPDALMTPDELSDVVASVKQQAGWPT
jgi:hypothetical protein